MAYEQNYKPDRTNCDPDLGLGYLGESTCDALS